MAYKGKGKEVAGNDPSAGGVHDSGIVSSSSPFAKRRKAVVSGPSGTGRWAKRRRPGVLQFFDDAALEEDDEDGFSSDEEDDEDMHFEHERTDFNSKVDVKTENNGPNGIGKTTHIPFFIKEEELSGDELEELIRNRYGHGSDFVTNEDSKEVDDKFEAKDAMIWRLKCTVGCERQVAFCFMQKYADLDNFGTKLAIISVFSLDHVKGYVFVEADKLSDVNEACKGFCNVYPTRVNLVPTSEVPQLFANRNKASEISVGTWVRMKGGKYKGDLSKVVAIDVGQRRATVKLVPRIDFSAIAKKFGGGVSLKLAPIPPPRLISSYELEKFGPHIEVKRDRQTGEEFEILDGMMLKDGYLYKRVSFGSFIYASVEPSNEELLKFSDKPKDKGDDLNWVSSVYDDDKEKCFPEVSDKASSSSKSVYDIHDLVLFGKKDFGVVIAEDKDYIRILKGGIEGVEVVAVNIKDIKNSCADKMFTASDQYMKTVVINDVIKVLDGPLQGREGIVKHMYKGSLFVRDDNEMENGGFFCVKSNSCGKIDSNGSARGDLGNDKSSLHREPFTRSSEQQNSVYASSRQNYDQKFHVGQTLRIRKGPLKGYLCRVVKIYRSDITVKLDSLVKMITVQEKFLSDLSTKRDHPTAISSDGLGAEGSLFIGSLSVGETGNQADKAAWNVGVHPVESDSWEPFSSDANNKKQTEHGNDPWGSGTTAAGGSDTMKDSWGASLSVAEQGKEDDPWGSKMTSGHSDCPEGSDNAAGNWGGEVSNPKSEADPWGSKAVSTPRTETGKSDKSCDGWDKTIHVVNDQKCQVDSWGDIASSSEPNVVGSKDSDGWGKPETSFAGWKMPLEDEPSDSFKSSICAKGCEAVTVLDKGKNDNLSQSTRAAVANNDDTCSWDNKGKILTTEEDAWGRASKYQSKNDDDQNGIDVGWEKNGNVGRHDWDKDWKADTGVDKGKSSWTHPEIGHSDKSCSWESKGKETINTEGDAWARSSETQQKQNACQDTTDVSWSKGRNSRSHSEWGKPTHLSSTQEPNWNKRDEQAAKDDPDSWNKPRTLDTREQKPGSSWGNESSWDKRPSGNADSHLCRSGSGWISAKSSDFNRPSSWDHETSSRRREAVKKTSADQQHGDYTGSWGQSPLSDKNENDKWDKPKSSAGSAVNCNQTGGAKKNDNNSGAWGQARLSDKIENDNWGKPKSSGGATVDWNETDDTGSWSQSPHTDKNANDNSDKPRCSGGDALNWNKIGGAEKNDNDNGAWGQITLPDKNENDNWAKSRSLKNADSCWGKDCDGWGNGASGAKEGLPNSNSTGRVVNEGTARGNSWGSSSSGWNSNNEENNWNKTKSSGGGNQFSWEKVSAETASTSDGPRDAQGASDQGSSWDKASSSWGKSQGGAGGSGGW